MDRIVLPALASLMESPNGVAWETMHPGIEIHRLQAGAGSGAASALLRYAPGATLPVHTHTGFEHIYVISGAQEDERGRYEAGTLVVNPPGSHHGVSSPTGCVVLVIWESPVVFKTPEG